MQPTPLRFHTLAAEGRVKELQQELRHTKHVATEVNADRQTALMLAAMHGHWPALQLLLPLYPREPHNLPSMADRYHNTALHYAVLCGRSSAAVAALVAAGADVGARNIAQLTPGDIARGHPAWQKNKTVLSLFPVPGAGRGGRRGSVAALPGSASNPASANSTSAAAAAAATGAGAGAGPGGAAGAGALSASAAAFAIARSGRPAPGGIRFRDRVPELLRQDDEFAHLHALFALIKSVGTLSTPTNGAVGAGAAGGAGAASAGDTGGSNGLSSSSSSSSSLLQAARRGSGPVQSMADLVSALHYAAQDGGLRPRAANAGDDDDDDADGDESDGHRDRISTPLHLRGRRDSSAGCAGRGGPGGPRGRGRKHSFMAQEEDALIRALAQNPSNADAVSAGGRPAVAVMAAAAAAASAQQQQQQQTPSLLLETVRRAPALLATSVGALPEAGFDGLSPSQISSLWHTPLGELPPHAAASLGLVPGASVSVNAAATGAAGATGEATADADAVAAAALAAAVESGPSWARPTLASLQRHAPQAPLPQTGVAPFPRPAGWASPGSAARSLNAGSNNNSDADGSSDTVNGEGSGGAMQTAQAPAPAPTVTLVLPNGATVGAAGSNNSSNGGMPLDSSSSASSSSASSASASARSTGDSGIQSGILSALSPKVPRRGTIGVGGNTPVLVQRPHAPSGRSPYLGFPNNNSGGNGGGGATPGGNYPGGDLIPTPTSASSAIGPAGLRRLRSVNSSNANNISNNNTGTTSGPGGRVIRGGHRRTPSHQSDDGLDPVAGNSSARRGGAGAGTGTGGGGRSGNNSRNAQNNNGGGGGHGHGHGHKDREDSGRYLQASDLQRILSLFGEEALPEVDLQAILAELDTNGDGRVDLEDFWAQMALRPHQSLWAEELAVAAPFAALDRDGDGLVTVGDLLKVKSLLGPLMPLNTPDEMAAVIDLVASLAGAAVDRLAETKRAAVAALSAGDSAARMAATAAAAEIGRAHV